MCEVCCASDVINAAVKDSFHTFRWRGSSHTLSVEADPLQEKFGVAEGPNRIRVRANNQAWSKWFSTRDLASVMSRLGVDIKWDYVPDEIRQWLEGESTNDQIIRYLHAKSPPGQLKLALSKTIAAQINTQEGLRETAKEFGVTQKELKRMIAEAV